VGSPLRATIASRSKQVMPPLLAVGLLSCPFFGVGVVLLSAPSVKPCPDGMTVEGAMAGNGRPRESPLASAVQRWGRSMALPVPCCKSVSPSGNRGCGRAPVDGPREGRWASPLQAGGVVACSWACLKGAGMEARGPGGVGGEERARRGMVFGCG